VALARAANDEQASAEVELTGYLFGS